MGYTSAKPHAATTWNGEQRYWYDANGNMTVRVELSGTQRITYTQAWDVDNRLIAVTSTLGYTTSFVYDGDGQRVLRKDATSTIAFIGAHFEQLRTSGGVTNTSYYYFGAQRVAMRTGNSVYWIHGDHLGSASLTTNISGQVVSEMRFYPFGEVRWQNGTTPTDRTFTGQLAEPSGLGSLMNYNAREYSPVLGRFLSADSVVPRPGDPQSLNRFSYARNSPISRLDPSGHGDCNVHTTAGCLPWTIADLVFQGPDYLYQVTVKPDNSFNPYDLSGVTTAHVQQAAQLFNVPAPYVAAALNFENQPSQLPWGAFRRYGKQLAAPILQRINPGYGSLGLGYSLGPANIKPGQAAVLVKYYLTSYDPQSPEYQWALSQSQLPKEGGFQEALPENAASYVAAGIRWGIDNYYSRGYSGPISKEGAAVVIGSYGQPYWYKLNKEPAPGGSYGVALIVNYADTKQGLPFLGQ